MKGRVEIFGVVVMASALLALLVGCKSDLELRSQVTKFRVLGMRTSPPEIAPGETTRVTALYGNPRGQDASVAWFSFEGEVNPSSFGEGGGGFVWLPSIEPISGAGVSSYMGDLGVPMDYLEGDDCDQDLNCPGECVFPFARRTVTFFAMACIDGLFDQILVQAVTAMNDAQEAFDEGEISYEELAVVNGQGMLAIGGLFSGFEDMNSLDRLCVGEDSRMLTSFKSVVVSEAPDSNTNPELSAFKFDDKYDGMTIECDDDDGCRDAVEIRAKLTDSSFEDQYQVKENCEWTGREERLYVSWFVSRFTDDEDEYNRVGEFSVDRSGPGDTEYRWFNTEWRPPKEGGEFRFYMVAHDIRGGVHWDWFDATLIAN